LTGVLSMLADFSKDAINASQAMAGDIMPDSLLSAGRVASAGCGSGPGAGGSGGGVLGSAGVSGGQASRLRSTRRGSGVLGRASSDGAGTSSSTGVGGETLEGGGGAGEQAGSLGGSTVVHPGSKRQRRTSARGKVAVPAAAAAADAAAQKGGGGSAGTAMLPPSRKAVGAAAGGAAAGAQPAAGSGMYSTRRSYAVPTDVALEPSQQVGVVIRIHCKDNPNFECGRCFVDVARSASSWALFVAVMEPRGKPPLKGREARHAVCCCMLQVGYDVGDTPETLLAAAAAGAGSRGPRRSADDAKKQAHMLQRLSSLRSRASS
jgi:hypothetical protein